MNHEIRSEQFDHALEMGQAADGFEELLELAGRLRKMPHPDFKDRLWAAMEGKMVMTTTVKLREGFRAVTPYLMVRDGAALAEFLVKAFGGAITGRTTAPKGGVHIEMRIGDSMLMIGGGEGLAEKGTAAIHLFVDDPDAVHAQAMTAGAKSLGAVEDRSYGERSGFVEDPFGNYWYIAKALPNAVHFHGLHTVNAYLHPKSSRELIEFLKQSFGGEELACYEHDGRVVHAQVRIGDSVVEMGDSEARPMTLYVYVDDPDAAYRKALAAGATSLWEPVDQPYGERNAGVVDPFGNQWYPARTIAGA